ncbi:p43 [Buzura suppressaria nucleopolyhedrovirus]|uniref:p43 n=1 Tax=Buzura suppressaria nuclear polyhedrosis virus TaxID=74320 RepID=W5VKJ6_NPVBS|nr:p43 [Buzura suppressaria nucleopolyhedrovirus]AHH82675.1 p43 [Buzura suppressaria nucleopolyhedrovirus]
MDFCRRSQRVSARKPFLFYSEAFVLPETKKRPWCRTLNVNYTRRPNNWHAWKSSRVVDTKWKAVMVVNDFLDQCLPNRYRGKNKIHLIISLMTSLTRVSAWDDGFYLWIKHLIVPRSEWDTFTVSKYAGVAIEYIVKRMWKRVPMSNVRDYMCMFINTIDSLLLRHTDNPTYHENWLNCNKYMLSVITAKQRSRLPKYISNIFYCITSNFKSNVRPLLGNPSLLCRYLRLFSINYVNNNHNFNYRLDLLFSNLLHKFTQCNMLSLYEMVYFKFVKDFDLENLDMVPVCHETICKLEYFISKNYFYSYKELLWANTANKKPYFHYNGWCPNTLRVLKLAKLDSLTKMYYLKATSKPQREDTIQNLRLVCAGKEIDVNMEIDL